MFGEDDIVKSHKARAAIIINLIILSFIIIIVRLWYLQIYRGDVLYKYSLENRLRKEVVKAPRGLIFSRNNQLLVNNIPRFDAIVTPQYLKNKKTTLKKLSQTLNMPLESIEKILKKNRSQARYRPVVVKKNISQKEVAVLETEAAKMPGVSVDTFISREYRDAEVGGHLFGYIGEISQTQLPKYRKRDNFDYKLGDFIGKAGIEEKFDLDLRGDDGFQFMEVDARGRMKRVVSSGPLFGEIENRPASPGNSVRLTIDRDMQITAFKALEGKVGGAVAVDVKTGEILTMVSRPSFDPSKFSRGLTSEYWAQLVNDENNPLRDRNIQDHFSPGSTFKTITALAALEEGIVTPNTEWMCGGAFKFGRRYYHDWKRGGHGLTDVYKALRRSVDVYFYKIATLMDIDVLAKYAMELGFGRKTGITLPRETSGLIPTKEWKKKRNGEEWQKGETLSCAIGQSFVLVTPIQLAMAYAAIANGGILYRPHLIKEIFNNNGDILKKIEPEIVSRVGYKKENLDAVRKGLYQVANMQGGTAWWYRGRGIRMAGKTGTSQVMSMTKDELFSKCEEMPYRQRHHGLFAAFAPYDDPKVAVAVIVEHGCHGSSAAAPVARDIITTYMKKYEPELHAKYAEEDKAIAKKAWLAAKRKKEELEKKKQEAEASSENSEGEE
ncbi:MAG: penicillin-binding protein 2 [Halobacteriovorax sp.]|nr:penicillin-binding protein 2 [Halobacteriovorax sp.]|tara:strand:- start:6348 stop:8345 length:1998 start_codon:yes stop_codon:yes gene_type:complete